MAKDNKIRMPSTGAGITTYFEDCESKVELKPEYIIVMAIVVIIIEVILHTGGIF